MAKLPPRILPVFSPLRIDSCVSPEDAEYVESNRGLVTSTVDRILNPPPPMTPAERTCSQMEHRLRQVFRGYEISVRCKNADYGQTLAIGVRVHFLGGSSSPVVFMRRLDPAHLLSHPEEILKDLCSGISRLCHQTKGE